MTDNRFPASVFGVGSEPDARFSLANERTFLAWIRTGLALLAGGVALEALGLGIHPGFRLAASLILLVAGLLTPLQAWFGWKRSERALRLGEPLPAAPLTLVLAVAVSAVGVLVLIGVLVR
ncbi:YidH family protein [Leifsonia sp. 2MCAF36]|uniref:YidH family protein n=1 Tax=Leifsonia sp. 2MCAF36 TaxID=3232988 RepID=UPI003F9B90F2